jgi:hypothetical protein
VARAIRASHSSHEKRKFYSELRKQFWRCEECRKRMQEAAAKSQRLAAYRASMSDRMRARWNDPEQREKLTRANKRRNTSELKRANSERMAARWADPTFRELNVAKMKATKAGHRLACEKVSP